MLLTIQEQNDNAIVLSAFTSRTSMFLVVKVEMYPDGSIVTIMLKMYIRRNPQKYKIDIFDFGVRRMFV